MENDESRISALCWVGSFQVSLLQAGIWALARWRGDTHKRVTNSAQPSNAPRFYSRRSQRICLTQRRGGCGQCDPPPCSRRLIAKRAELPPIIPRGCLELHTIRFFISIGVFAPRPSRPRHTSHRSISAERVENLGFASGLQVQTNLLAL